MLNKDPKSLSNSDLRYYFRMVLKRIKSKRRGHFVFRRIRGAHGLFCWDDGIHLDHRKLLIPAIIHEVLHDIYPNNWEGWVYRVESKIVNIMTPKDVYDLMSTFVARMDKGVAKRSKKKKTKR